MADGIRISKKTVDALEAKEARYRVWDKDLTGFGLRVTPSGVKTYMVTYRPKGGGRRTAPIEFTIGKHGAWTPDMAREKAREVLRLVAEGKDPQGDKQAYRLEMTVSELCDLYIEKGCGTKKASTIQSDKFRIERHIKPLLGRMRVSDVTQAHVRQFMTDVASGKTAVAVKPSVKQVKAGAPRGAGLRGLHDPVVRGGQGTATRTVGLLGGVFTYAGRVGDANPVSGVNRFKDRVVERHLSPDELARLGAFLEHTAVNEKAVNVIRLLVLTGCRLGEIETLKKTEVVAHLNQLHLGDSKTGYKVVPLGTPALSVLKGLDYDPRSPFVFPATDDPDRPFTATGQIWRKIRSEAGLEGVRLHDLRHTFATMGVMASGNLSLVGKILGHRDVKTTQKYEHLIDGPVRDAVEATSEVAAQAMRGEVGLTEEVKAQILAMAGVGIDEAIIARGLGVSIEAIRKEIKRYAKG